MKKLKIFPMPINMLKILQLETLASLCVFFSISWKLSSIKCFNRHAFVAQNHVKLARLLLLLNLSTKNVNHIIKQMYDKQVTILSIYNLDSSYQINKARYPLLALGRTDYTCHFFPIAMALLAKEKTSDFIWLFISLKKISFIHFGLDLEKIVTYIYKDSCDAEYNATS